MKRAGFTMIELIFVIVILGILAAVAIPKLAATREDAEATAALATWKTAVTQIQAETVAQGVVPNFTTIVDAGTNMLVTADVITAQARINGTVSTCATGTDDNNGTLTIAISNTTGGCVLFTGVQAGTIGLTGGSVQR